MARKRSLLLDEQKVQLRPVTEELARRCETQDPAADHHHVELGHQGCCPVNLYPLPRRAAPEPLRATTATRPGVSQASADTPGPVERSQQAGRGAPARSCSLSEARSE